MFEGSPAETLEDCLEFHIFKKPMEDLENPLVIARKKSWRNF